MIGIKTAHAQSSSSIEIFNSVASSTGQIIQDSFPLFEMFLGLLIAIIFATLIMRVAISAFRALVKGKRSSH